MKITKLKLTQIVSETIQAFLLERKFDPKMLDAKEFTNQSKMAEFVLDLAQTHPGLRYLGEGSSRMVFSLDSKRVLKVALNDAGIAQNEAEIDISFDPSVGGIVAKVFAQSNANKWIVSELVRPLKDKEEFKFLTGISWDFFSFALQGWGTGRLPEWINNIRNNSIKPWSSPVKSHKELEEYLTTPFYKTVFHALNHIKTVLMHGDLTKIGHWGKTPDQRVVLLDYGFTPEVADKHY